MLKTFWSSSICTADLVTFRFLQVNSTEISFLNLSLCSFQEIFSGRMFNVWYFSAAMLRFIFRSSRLYRSISPPPGFPSSLIFTSWSAPSQQAFGSASETSAPSACSVCALPRVLSFRSSAACLRCVCLCSGSVRHQRGVFRRCDGAAHADSDAGGVRSVGRVFLQRVWALYERRAQAGRSSGWRRHWRRRQEELWESLW